MIFLFLRDPNFPTYGNGILMCSLMCVLTFWTLCCIIIRFCDNAYNFTSFLLLEFLPQGQHQILRDSISHSVIYVSHLICSDTHLPRGRRLNVASGGETVFPRSAEKPDYDSMQGTFSKCSRMGLSVKPEKGDAVFFWDMKRTDNGPYAPDVNAKLDARGVPSGWALDHTSMHAACPVVRGVKWSAPVWIHSKPFFGPSRNAPNPAVEADMGWGSCLDQFSMCKEWAMKGECESNRAFMVGTAYNKGTGACLKSCNLCTPSIEEELHSLSPKCVDQHDMCEEWATGGQCTENPAFMVGAEGFVGQCMMSCGKCDP